MAKRKYVAEPGADPATRAPIKVEEISKALSSLPELVTFETVTVGERFQNTFHSTASHELIHVQHGKARIKFRRRSFTVGPRDTFMIPRGTEHRDVRLSEGPYRAFYCFFHWDSGDELVRRIAMRRPGAIPTASRELLHHLMIEFEREYIGKSGSSPERVSLVLMEVLLALVRCSRPAAPERGSAAARVARQERRALAVRAKRYLEERFRENVGLEEMARAFDVSTYHLSRSFSRHFGMSIPDVLATVRVDYAKELLREGGMTVKEIAAAAGYSGGNYFAKVFRRVCGQSPSEYRLLSRKGRGR